MRGRLPENLSTLSTGELRRERTVRDRRLTPLFRRWPSLSERELLELRRVYAERQLLARYLGILRRRRRATRGE